MAKKSTSNKEFQIVRSWLELEDPLGIVTHIDVDADAVFSAALLQTLRPCVPVHFVQANFEIETEEAIAVDMLNGPRARRVSLMAVLLGSLSLQSRNPIPSFTRL